MNHNTVPEDIKEIADKLVGKPNAAVGPKSTAYMKLKIAQAILAERKRSERTIQELEARLRQREEYDEEESKSLNRTIRELEYQIKMNGPCRWDSKTDPCGCAMPCNTDQDGGV